MVQNLLKKAPHLRPAHILALIFLLYIGYVAMYPLKPLLERTKALIKDEISPTDYIDTVDELYHYAW